MSMLIGKLSWAPWTREITNVVMTPSNCFLVTSPLLLAKPIDRIFSLQLASSGPVQAAFLLEQPSKNSHSE
jgi:hypothetical protein